MVEKNYQKIIILEDDARFSSNFKSVLNYFKNEMQSRNFEWDLV